ncbi:MAG: division/cell wall cluster transcriptional repressor MraZ [Bacteroidales bacterium]
MSNLIGTYECKADAKGRLMFPSAFKGQLEESLKEGFVIKRSVFLKCLELYPMDEWDKESERVNRLNRFVKKNVDFIRKFMAGVKKTSLDGTGRLLIPRDLIKFAGIKKEVVLASVVNKLEIWDKEAYENMVDYDPDEFANLAEEVMGNEKTGTENE